MADGEACAFCSPRVVWHLLWESEHYRILADAFPRCAGHVLLVTKAHFRSHQHAPADWLPEFEAAQRHAGQFLLETFGAATFYENGGARQEVPHAHLHGLPFAATIAETWIAEERIRPVRGWSSARNERERAGFYFYLESGGQAFLVRDYEAILLAVRDQLISQTEARLTPSGDELQRGGEERVRQTRALWRRWEDARRGPSLPSEIPT